MFWPLLAFLAAAAIRAAQALLDATPYLLAGTFAAGVVPVFLGPARLRRALAGRRGPLVAAGFAALLPVCSIGAIPLLVALGRAGAPRGAWLTFALAAGILNPITLAYALTLFDPGTLALLAAAALAPAILAGARVPAAPGPGPDAAPIAAIPFGPRRLAATIWFGARELAGPALPWIALALLGAGLLGAAVPHGSLDTAILADDPLAPLRMGAIAPPAHVTPERAAMLAAEIFEHTCSAGAAYLLLALGAGVNLGLLGLVLRTLGPRRAAGRLALAGALALALGYTLHAGLRVAGAEAGHTHVFDRMTNPFADWHDARHLAFVARKELAPLPAAPLAALGLLLATGLAARHEPFRRRVEAILLASRPAAASTGVWSRPLPARALAGGAFVSALFAAAALVLVYYPPPEDTFDEMRMTRADAFSALASRSVPAALRSLSDWDTLNGKLVVGTLLRRGPLPAPQRDAARALGDSIDALRKALAVGAPPDETRRIARAVEDAYADVRRAYGRP